MALTNAFECVNADRIRLSGNGGWFRVAFFPRLFRPTLPLVNSQSEFASRDVEGISAPWNERRLDGQSRPAPHGGRPFFFCGSTLQFHNPPCLFPSPSPSLVSRAAPASALLCPRAPPRLGGIRRGGGLSLSSRWKL